MFSVLYCKSIMNNTYSYAKPWQECLSVPFSKLGLISGRCDYTFPYKADKGV